MAKTSSHSPSKSHGLIHRADAVASANARTDAEVLSRPELTIGYAPFRLLRTPLRALDISPVIDERRWRPEPYTPPLTIYGNRAPVKVWSSPKIAAKAARSLGRKGGVIPSLLSYKIAFKAPSKVVVCVRRKIRREVLASKGFSKPRNQRHNRWHSSIHC